MAYNKKSIVVNFLNSILNQYDFQLLTEINSNGENVFKLKDLQNGNLGNIQNEEFLNLADIIDKLDIYHQDYIYNSLEERENNNEIIKKDDWDLTVKRYFENDNVDRILSEINPTKYENLLDKNDKFDIYDIIEILNESEVFYKTVCRKYVETMSKEMLLEIDDKIVHIYIDDDYINLKEQGKINSQNYKDYLDENFEVYEYKFYQDLYNSTIRDEIAYDLNDLELFDENGKWNFYITFEELKQVGFGFMIKDNYPLIEKYAVSEDKIFDFYNHFSLEQLDDFEKTLHLYFETDDMNYDKETLELYSKSNSDYNSNIICLAEGAVSYEDFLFDYELDDYLESYKKEIVIEKVAEYFRENEIKDLMEYGSDSDEGLYKLSSMYEDIMNKLDIKCSNIFTEDVSDGRYLTTLVFENGSSINVDTSAWDGIKTITKNVKFIDEFYNEIIRKKDEEIDYDYE